MTTKMQFTASVTFTVDTDEWEGAGYDPIDPDPAKAAEQVASWVRHMAYVGPDHVPAEVHEIQPGRQIPVDHVLGGDEPVVMLCTDGSQISARTPDGGLLISFPKPDRLLVAGDLNEGVYHRALEVALMHIGRRSPID